MYIDSMKLLVGLAGTDDRWSVDGRRGTESWRYRPARSLFDIGGDGGFLWYGCLDCGVRGGRMKGRNGGCR
jgi:hypothetical protein